MADAVQDGPRSDQRAGDRPFDPADFAPAGAGLRRTYRRASRAPRPARPRPLYGRGDGRLHDRGDHGCDRARRRRARDPFPGNVRRIRGRERPPRGGPAGQRDRGFHLMEIHRRARGRGGRDKGPDLRHCRGRPAGQGCGVALADHPRSGAARHRAPDPGRAAGRARELRQVDSHCLGGKPGSGARDRRCDRPAGEGGQGDGPFGQGGAGLAYRRRRSPAPPRVARGRLRDPEFRGGGKRARGCLSRTVRESRRRPADQGRLFAEPSATAHSRRPDTAYPRPRGDFPSCCLIEPCRTPLPRTAR